MQLRHYLRQTMRLEVIQHGLHKTLITSEENTMMYNTAPCYFCGRYRKPDFPQTVSNEKMGKGPNCDPKNSGQP